MNDIDAFICILTRDLNGATLTNDQARQLKSLIDLAVLRGAQPAILRPLTRVMHDGELDDK